MNFYIDGIKVDEEGFNLKLKKSTRQDGLWHLVDDKWTHLCYTKKQSTPEYCEEVRKAVKDLFRECLRVLKLDQLANWLVKWLSKYL